MRPLLFAFTILVVGCSSPDTPATPSGAAPSASTQTAASTTAAGSATPASSSSSSSESGGGLSAAALDAKKNAAPAPQDSGVPVSSLVNQDGHIDSGLPKTAAWGAKLPKTGDPIVILQTTAGNIYVKFFPQKAPNHVKNFLKLASSGFYDGTKFHRVIPGFMIQGGDPNTKTDDTSTWGQGGPGYNVKHEFNDIPHTRGILSMARTGDPDGAGSQFFVMHAEYPSLNGQYSVFGQVISGMDVVDKIVNAPSDPATNRPNDPTAIKKAVVTKWPVTFSKS